MAQKKRRATPVVRFSGKKLRDLRENKGWSRAKLTIEVYLASGVEISESHIRHYEEGRHEPGASIFIGLCLAFGVKPIDIADQ